LPHAVPCRLTALKIRPSGTFSAAIHCTNRETFLDVIHRGARNHNLSKAVDSRQWITSDV